MGWLRELPFLLMAWGGGGSIRPAGMGRVVAATVLVTAAVVGVRLSDDGLPPPRDDQCFSQPGACGFPDPDYGNIGVPSGTSLTPLSGDITYSTPGQTIDGVEITGHVNITANNVTIRNSRIIGNATVSNPDGGSQEVVQLCACTVTFEDVEFTTESDNNYEFMTHGPSGGGDTQTFTRVYQHGNVDLFAWSEGTLTVQDSYSIIGKEDGEGGWEPVIPEDHLENIYINDATLTVDHSVLFLPVPQTSTLFANTANGPEPPTTPCSNQITMTDNLLAGGGRVLTTCGHSTGAGTSVVTITGNRIARCEEGNEVQGGSGTWLCPSLFDHPGSNDGNGYYPNGGSFGLVSDYYAASSTWSNNVWDDTSATISEP